MKNRTSLTTPALVVAFAVAALLGIMLPSPSGVYAADPTFDLVSDTSGSGDRCVEENTPPGVNIGDPISATDPDETGDEALEFGSTLTYSLGGMTRHRSTLTLRPDNSSRRHRWIWKRRVPTR